LFKLTVFPPTRFKDFVMSGEQAICVTQVKMLCGGIISIIVRTLAGKRKRSAVIS
jgi:hypothetical protein